MLWFERRFDLGVPHHLFPNIVERLRGTPDRLAERVTHTPIDPTVRTQGQWSVLENAGHLLDLEPLWLGRVDDLFAGAEALREADLENRKTHEAQHNNSEASVVLQSFRSERAKLIRRLDSLAVEQLAHTSLHPRLRQPMTVVDLSFFVAEHDDHHLARITQLGLARIADEA